MPMEVVRQRFPISSQLAFLAASVRRRVHNQMVSGGNFLQTTQYPAEKSSQMAPVGARTRLLEKVIVTPVYQPNLVGHPRGIWAQCVVVTLYINDALSLTLFLAHHVAKNTALFVVKPFV